LFLTDWWGGGGGEAFPRASSTRVVLGGVWELCGRGCTIVQDISLGICTILRHHLDGSGGMGVLAVGFFDHQDAGQVLYCIYWHL